MLLDYLPNFSPNFSNYFGFLSLFIVRMINFSLMCWLFYEDVMIKGFNRFQYLTVVGSDATFLTTTLLLACSVRQLLNFSMVSKKIDENYAF